MIIILFLLSINIYFSYYSHKIVIDTMQNQDFMSFLASYDCAPKYFFFMLDRPYPLFKACFILALIYFVTFKPYTFLPYIKSSRSSSVNYLIMLS